MMSLNTNVMKNMKMNEVSSSMSWIGFTSAIIMAFAIDNTFCRFLGRSCVKA